MLIGKLHHLHKRFFCCSSLPIALLSSSSSPQANYLHYQLDHFFTTPSPNIKACLQSHAFIITTGHSNNLYIAAKLISLYSSFNKPHVSTQVFNTLDVKDTFLWNSIIKSHFSNGDYPQTLKLFSQMHNSATLPDPFTVPMVASSCAELSSVELGRAVHCVALKHGLFGGNAAIGSSFVYCYCKCNGLGDASKVFGEMSIRDVVAWTALVNGYVQNDEWEKGLDCLSEMHKSGGNGGKPNFRTIEGGLRACEYLGDILKGRCLHGYAVKTGNGFSQFVQSAILSMYAKCGNKEEIDLAFNELVDKDIISWTVVIGFHARNGSIPKCLDLFQGMLDLEVDPDSIVISSLLSGFGNALRFYEGRTFHGMIIRRYWELDQVVKNSLLSMYCKFGYFHYAEMLFNRLCLSDSEPWNSMIVGYGRLGLVAKCMELFREMHSLGVETDLESLVLVISVCSKLVAMNLGRSIHCNAIKMGKDENNSITNALVGLYGQCGKLNIARRLFCRAHKDVVAWNTLISAYTHNGHHKEALFLFDKMVLSNIGPNSVTLLIVLSACSRLADIDHGKRAHTYITEMGLECDISLVTALVDMYAKCGQLGLSREIFDSMPEKDLISWNVMISGYGLHGDAKAAVELFHQMEESGVKPNELSFLAVLSACTHGGLFEEGEHLFSRMKNYFVVPTLKHFSCLVDLLGRSGKLCEAEEMVLSMPITPDGGVWGALLGSCRIHNDVQMGERVARRAIESDPGNDGYYIMLSNMYSSTGMWDEAENIRVEMKNRGVMKIAGWSTM